MQDSQYAALILPDSASLDAKPYMDAAARVLARQDPHPEGAPLRHLRSPRGGTVRGGFFSVRVDGLEDSDYGPKIVLTLRVGACEPAGAPTGERVASLLSDIVMQALSDSAADIVEWTSPEILIDRDEFITLRSYVSPRRTRPAGPGDGPRRPGPGAGQSAPDWERLELSRGADPRRDTPMAALSRGVRTRLGARAAAVAFVLARLRNHTQSMRSSPTG